MNKSELIKTIATESGLNHAQASDALNAFCKTVIDELANGGEVEIKGFGSFTTHERAERMGRNPKTGEPALIPASRVAKFKAGKSLKDGVA